MDRRKFLIGSLGALGSLMGLSGCKNFLDKKDPTATTFDEFYNDQSDLQRTVYSSFRDVFDNKGDRRLLFYMWDGDSDNAYSRLESDNHKRIANGNYDAETRCFEYYYTIHMKQIARMNRYIANVDKPFVTNESVRELAKLEYICVRMWHYFFVTHLWGGVPFVQKPVSLSEATIGKTPKKKILDHLFNEGEKVAEKLPSEKFTVDYYRFNRWSFKALMMRYALYDKRYKLAIRLAKEIMNSGQYKLYPKYIDLFKYKACSNNDEFILWQSKTSYVGTTWSFNHLAPHYSTGNGDSYLVPLKSLVDSYWTKDGYTIENSPKHSKEEYELNPKLDRDPRYAVSIMGNGDLFDGHKINIYDTKSTFYHEKERASSSGYWFRKFVDKADLFRSGGHFEYGLIRYAEVLLTYAEAKIMQNDIDHLAKECINKIRSRAGLNMSKADVTLPRYDGYSQKQWIDLIQRERRIEFAAEGQRYNDIIRWGIADEVLNQPALGDTRIVNGKLESLHVENRSFNSPTNYKWAFPENTLKINPNLEQNPGY
jgi:hypothetical protein